MTTACHSVRLIFKFEKVSVLLLLLDFFVKKGLRVLLFGWLEAVSLLNGPNHWFAPPSPSSQKMLNFDPPYSPTIWKIVKNFQTWTITLTPTPLLHMNHTLLENTKYESYTGRKYKI